VSQKKVVNEKERHQSRGINSLADYFLKYIGDFKYLTSEEADIPIRKIKAKERGFNPDDPTAKNYVDVIDASNSYGYDKKNLENPLNNQLDFTGYSVQDFLRTEIIPSMTKSVFFPALGCSVPAFGAHSDLIRSCQFFAYDNPKVVALSGCKTAFVDNAGHIFIHADFMNKLLEEAYERDGNAVSKFSNLKFLIVHELSHMLLHHFVRMQNVDAKIANIAGDLFINTGLTKDFGLDATGIPELSRLDPTGILRNTGIGFADGDMEMYGNVNEETIVKMILEDKDNPFNPDNPNNAQQGEGEGEGEGPSSIKLSKEDIKDILNRIKNGKMPPPSGCGGGIDISFDDDVTEEEKQALNDALTESGVEAEDNASGGMDLNGGEDGNPEHGVLEAGEVRDIMEKSVEDAANGANKVIGLDKTDEMLETDKTDFRGTLVNSIRSSEHEAQSHGDKYPGGHLLSYASKLLPELNESKIDWSDRLSGWMSFITDEVCSRGELVHDVHYSELNAYEPMAEIKGFDHLMMEDEIYTISGRIVCVVDTSASMTGEELKQAFGECIGIAVNGFDDSGEYKPEVVIYCADTALRGEPIIINKENYEDVLAELGGFEAHGGGGTDMLYSLNHALESERDLGETVDGAIILSDWGFSAPSEHEIEELEVPVIITGMESSYADSFKDLDSDTISIIQIPLHDEEVVEHKISSGYRP